MKPNPPLLAGIATIAFAVGNASAYADRVMPTHDGVEKYGWEPALVFAVLLTFLFIAGYQAGKINSSHDRTTD